jgi:hypothetical protein
VDVFFDTTVLVAVTPTMLRPGRHCGAWPSAWTHRCEANGGNDDDNMEDNRLIERWPPIAEERERSPRPRYLAPPSTPLRMPPKCPATAISIKVVSARAK